MISRLKYNIQNCWIFNKIYNFVQEKVPLSKKDAFAKQNPSLQTFQNLCISFVHHRIIQ